MTYPVGTIVQVVRNTRNVWYRPYRQETIGQKYLVLSTSPSGLRYFVATLSKHGKKTSWEWHLPAGDIEPVEQGEIKMEDFL